ncbi:bucentaur or craniofacial development protein [Ceratobasidium sp. AG-Ba]|nr:bucentaur or craniofacial development protein [Ceratobasidium sp. AG-Ba]QRW10874.1 bucentaur or craniofacial development protein [Ceratobasidium sp. AG-Ba]
MPEPLTLNSALLDSDDEDEDYVPDEHESDSDEDTKRESKKQRVEEPESAPVNPVMDDTARNSLWESFLESATTSASVSSQVTPAPEPKKIVIERRHRFAGEDVTEKVQVAEDSAKALEWKKKETSSTPAQTSSPIKSPLAATPVSSEPSTRASSSCPSLVDPVKQGAKQAAVKPKAVAKPRKSLSSLAAAAKPKKLTTLEKSKLDWQAHLAAATPEERDELERNRQAGGAGYLEKVDFLARVGERRENAFEDSKRKRR